MVDAGVQIPLDALARSTWFFVFGSWSPKTRNEKPRTIQDVGEPGNPPAWGAGERRFKSDHPDWTDCPVAQWWCGCLLSRRLQVRLLPGHLGARREQGCRTHIRHSIFDIRYFCLSFCRMN